MKSLSLTTVRLHSEFVMFSPYRCVFGFWLSVAVLSEMVLSSHGTPSLVRMWIPSRLVTSSALFVIVLREITLRLPPLIWMPCSPELSMIVSRTWLSVDGLFGCPADEDAFVMLIP